MENIRVIFAKKQKIRLEKGLFFNNSKIYNLCKFYLIFYEIFIYVLQNADGEEMVIFGGYYGGDIGKYSNNI